MIRALIQYWSKTCNFTESVLIKTWRSVREAFVHLIATRLEDKIGKIPFPRIFLGILGVTLNYLMKYAILALQKIYRVRKSKLVFEPINHLNKSSRTSPGSIVSQFVYVESRAKNTRESKVNQSLKSNQKKIQSVEVFVSHQDY